MLITMYSQCINAGIPVYPTENYCTNLVNNAELSKNLQTLKQLIDKGLKVALIHNENLRFHEGEEINNKDFTMAIFKYNYIDI